MKYLDELLISWQIWASGSSGMAKHGTCSGHPELGHKKTSASECVSFDSSGGALGSWFQTSLVEQDPSQLKLRLIDSDRFW